MKYIISFVLLVGGIYYGIETFVPNTPDTTCIITKVVAYLPHRYGTESVCECVDKTGKTHSIVSNNVEFPKNIYYLTEHYTRLDIFTGAFVVAIYLFLMIWLFRVWWRDKHDY